MKIQYRDYNNYLSVDIKELRPKGSYGNLIKKRTHSIDQIISKYGKIPEDYLRSRKCPTCESNNYQIELEKDYMTIVHCNECNLIYTNPIFDEDHYFETYKSIDYQNIVKDLGEESHNYRVKRFGSERVKIISRFFNSKKTLKLLDVGCSTGFVVEAAIDNGWDAVGIDLNPSAVDFGKSRGLNLLNKSLEELTFDKEHFDIITMFDVLEHLSNPQEILQLAIEYLAVGGVIFLYVPNWDSASRILLGKDAHFIWPTHHLNYYNIETISALMKRVGLQVEFVTTEGLDIIDYIWREKKVKKNNVEAIENIADELQFFINAGGYGKNLRVLARKL